MAASRLHQKAPREQIGAGTGSLFEYQYTQAAIDCLLLFEDAVCVYCEWHDDYVVEHGNGVHPSSATPIYRFHQVKTRKISLGPWSLNDLFGIDTRKKPDSQPDPRGKPFPYMLEHALNFEHECDSIVFVTNNDVDEKVSKLLEEAGRAVGPSILSEKPSAWFARILGGCKQVYPQLDEATLLRVLKRFRVLAQRGNPDEGETQLITLGVRISDLSEVELKPRQAERMGRDVLDLVRQRSGVKIEPVPANLTDAELRARKAVLVKDLLNLISLSPEGYKILRSSNDKGALRDLSRLQRYCENNHLESVFVADICGYKASWDAWSISENSRLDRPGLTSLHAECSRLLTAYAAMPSGAGKTLAWFVTQAKDVAGRYAPQWSTIRPLTATEVLGLIFKLAADRGT